MHRGTCWGMLLVAAGCGGGSAQVAVAPVSGIVNYNGIPVRDAYVKFSQEGSPVIAGGFTDETGRFKLTTYEPGDGAPVGEHKVTVSVSAPPADQTGDEQAKAEAIADSLERKKAISEIGSRKKAAQAAGGGGAKTAQPRSSIPKKYASGATSPLSFTVKAGVENKCPLELTD